MLGEVALDDGRVFLESFHDRCILRALPMATDSARIDVMPLHPVRDGARVRVGAELYWWIVVAVVV